MINLNFQYNYSGSGYLYSISNQRLGIFFSLMNNKRMPRARIEAVGLHAYHLGLAYLALF